MKLVVFAGMVALLLAGCGKHPTDASLQASLQKNYVAFSNLVTELKAVSSVERVEWDGLQIIVDNAQTNPPGLAPKLSPHFKAIGQPLFVHRPSGSQVWFYFSRRGLSVSGSAKGIVYDETTPTRVVPDTDASSQTNAPFTVFRPLVQSNWFAFYSR